MGRFLDDAQKRIEENNKTIDENAQKKIDNATAAHDSNIQTAEREYADAERAATDDYVSVINSIDLQKALDIKDIQETRANMGLSRSGISATEQTAAILAAGNRTNATRNQLQKTVDSLTKSLADYKVGQNQELQSTILSVNEWADQSKAESSNAIMADANEQQQTMLKALGLDSDIYAQAIEQGWDGEEAWDAQISKNNDTINEWFNNGYIFESVRNYAIENGLTPQQTLDLQEQEKAKQNENDRIAGIRKLYDDGKIDGEVYLASITDSTVTAEGALLNMMRKTETAQKNATKANNDAVIRVFNSLSDEEQQAFGEDFALALENGWTPSQFYKAISGKRDTVKNIAALDELRSTNQIDQATYDAAIANGTNANEVKTAYDKKVSREKELNDTFSGFRNYIENGGTVYNVSSIEELEDLINKVENKPWYIFGTYSKDSYKYGDYKETLSAVEKLVDLENSNSITKEERNQLLFNLGIDQTTYFVLLQQINKELQKDADDAHAASKAFGTGEARKEQNKIPRSTAFQQAVNNFNIGLAKTGPINRTPTVFDLPTALSVIEEYNSGTENLPEAQKPIPKDSIPSFLKAVGFDDNIAENYKQFL